MLLLSCRRIWSTSSAGLRVEGLRSVVANTPRGPGVDCSTLVGEVKSRGVSCVVAGGDGLRGHVEGGERGERVVHVVSLVFVAGCITFICSTEESSSSDINGLMSRALMSAEAFDLRSVLRTRKVSSDRCSKMIAGSQEEESFAFGCCLTWIRTRTDCPVWYEGTDERAFFSCVSRNDWLACWLL